MPRPILPVFEKFKDEAAIVGRLLAGYAELEIGLLNCVANARDDFDMVLKVMFKTRSVSQRIDAADAMGRYKYHQSNLGTEFEMAVGAVRHCLKIRNKYAHCTWHNDQSGKLAFVNLEEPAQMNVHVPDLSSLTISHVDVALLRDQEAYFVYTDELLSWVNFEGRCRTGKLNSNPLPKPAPMKKPPLHLPQ